MKDATLEALAGESMMCSKYETSPVLIRKTMNITSDTSDVLAFALNDLEFLSLGKGL